MIAAVGKFLLAVAMGAVAIIAAICAVTGRWPTMVVVQSRLPASECSFAFSDGFTWNVDLKPGQERFWLFVLGRPEKVAARPGWQAIPAVRNQRLFEIKSPIILQPGPAALTDGLQEMARHIQAFARG